MKKKLRKIKDSSRTVVVAEYSAANIVFPNQKMGEVNNSAPALEQLFSHDNFSNIIQSLESAEKSSFDALCFNCLSTYSERNERSPKASLAAAPRLFFTEISLPKPVFYVPVSLEQQPVQALPLTECAPVVDDLGKEESVKIMVKDDSSTSWTAKTKPENSKIHLVVDAILKLDTCSFTKGQVTKALKNKKMNAAEIGAVLTFLVQEKALQRENTVAGSQGGRPAEQYLIIYGNSSYFKKDK